MTGCAYPLNALTKRAIRVIAGGALVMVLALGTAMAQGTPTAAETDGQGLYNQHCASCHGLDGKGAGWTALGLGKSPTPFNQYLSEDISKTRMLNSVRNGVTSNSAMPAYGRILNDGQINAVVSYIREVLMTEASDDPALLAFREPEADGALYPGNLTGNTERGQVLYELNCASCHGAGGNGDGPRAALIIPPLRPLTDAANKNPLDVFQNIAGGREGTTMSAWRAVFNGQQIADLAEYTRTRLMTGDGAPIADSGLDDTGLGDEDGFQTLDEGNDLSALSGDILPEGVADQDGFQVIGEIDVDDDQQTVATTEPSPTPITDEEGFMVIGEIDDGPGEPEPEPAPPPQEPEASARPNEPKPGSAAAALEALQPSPDITPEEDAILQDLANSDDLGLDAVQELINPSPAAPEAPAPDAAPKPVVTPPTSLAPVDASPDEITDRGRSLYAQRCSTCHGADGRGKTPAAQALQPPPPDLTQKQKPTLEVANAAMTGQLGIYQEAHDFRGQLGPRDIADIAVYLIDKVIPGKDRVLFHTDANGWPDHRTKFATAYPFADGRLSLASDTGSLTPDQQAGLAMFREHCVACHTSGPGERPKKLQWKSGS